MVFSGRTLSTQAAGEKQANRLNNLEAFYHRGFHYDFRTNCYVSGRIMITQDMLDEKDIYMKIDPRPYHKQ